MSDNKVIRDKQDPKKVRVYMTSVAPTYGLNEFKGHFIMSNHDHKLLNSTANRIIEITPRGIIDQLMTFDEYLDSEKVKEQQMELYR